MEKNQIRHLIREIQTRFPCVLPLMEKHDSEEFTFLMEEFANLTTYAFNQNNLADAQSHLSFISLKLESASLEELEYIDTYYVEHLFWKGTPQGIEIGWPLVPENLKKMYLDFHGHEPKAKL